MKIEIGNIPVSLILILDLHQGHQTIYDQGVQKLTQLIKSDIDIEFEENLLHQERIISEIYQRPDKNYFQEPKDFESLILNCAKVFAKTSRHQQNFEDNPM